MALGEADFRQLIPLLHPRTRIQDMDVLKAWYEAVEDALRAELPADLLAYVPGWSSVGLSGEVFAFAAVMSLGTGLAAGLTPAVAR